MTESLDFKRTVDRAGEKDRQRAGLRAGSHLGEYRIIRLLGRGGMGEVYEVEHEVLNLRYALKLIPDELVSQRGFLERFKREAQVMAHLKHPNIVKVDDFGEDNGHYWFRMELLEGIDEKGERIITLADLREVRGGRVEPDLLAGILTQILDGLAYAHRKGVVHRDLKPANILLSGRDISSVKVKIADFGLVRLIGEEWVLSRAKQSISSGMSLGNMPSIGEGKSGTSTRAILGTYEYMSPEQKEGEKVDVRSDLYAVGLIAFRLLTGERELGLKLPSEVNKDISPAWDEFIRKSIEPHKEERFASAKEMLAFLPVVRVETITKEERESLSLKIPLQKIRLSRRMWLTLGGIFFALLLLSLLLFRPPPPPFPRRAYLIQSPLAELMSRPGKEGERVGSLLVGSEVKIISETNGWYRVRSPKGEGYLTKGSLGEKPPIFGFRDRIGRAHYYYRAANYSQAFEELSEAKTLNPRASEPYILSTLIYLARGEKENAFKEFQEALKRGIVGEHPLIVKIKTRHAILKAEPQKVKSIDGNIIELKDGSIFHGEIILERR